jgi:hypothetical protein
MIVETWATPSIGRGGGGAGGAPPTPSSPGSPSASDAPRVRTTGSSAGRIAAVRMAPRLLLPQVVGHAHKLQDVGAGRQAVEQRCGQARIAEHQKKIAETDAIFDQVNQINAGADAAAQVLRLSIDAKATVKLGPFARGGKRRAVTKACEHDFKPDATVTPVGIFLPATDELFLYGISSKVTSDCLVDRLEQCWTSVRDRFRQITTLVIHLDNGPETHSRRTQFMYRMVEFVRQTGLRVRLV